MSLLTFFQLSQPRPLPQRVKTPVLLSFLMSSLMAFVTISLFFTIQPVVPMFYSLAHPNDYLTPKIWLWFFPVFSFAMTLSHISLIRVLRAHEHTISEIFSWTTVILQVLLITAFLRILFLVL